ncbi:hypothetical protein ACFLR8_02925 [Bacteroidota bacterium]
MKRIAFILLIALAFTACEKDPETGDLLIIFEYDSFNQADVECTLYSSLENYDNYTFLERQFSDEFGEVFFSELQPGWYYFEGEKVFNSMFSIYVVLDSVKINPLQQSNKISIMHKANP